MNHVYIPEEYYKVFIRCYTYNHSEFIAEALHGFVIQKTNFPYVCVVVDDNSSDGNKNSIRDFIEKECDITKRRLVDIELSTIEIVSHRTNKNCLFAVYYLKKNLWGTNLKTTLMTPWRDHSKYEALCEGDDYWTDERKLQREVEFLDNNKQYSMVAENGWIINTITKEEKPFSTLPSREITKYEDLLRGRKYPTAGVLLRTDYVKGLYELNGPKHDTMIWCWMLSKGSIYYKDIISSVYRRGMQGVCEGTEHYKFGEQIEKWDLAIMNMFNVDRKYVYGTIARAYKYTMCRAIENHSYKSAFKSLKKIIIYLCKSL